MTVGELKVLLEGISDDTLLLTYDADDSAWYSPCGVGRYVVWNCWDMPDRHGYSIVYDTENEQVPVDKMVTAFLI
jgi:hypothetical protein